MMSSGGHRHCHSLLIAFVLFAVRTVAVDITHPRISSLDRTLHSQHDGETLKPLRPDSESGPVTGLGGGWARATRSLLQNGESGRDSGRDSAAMSVDNYGKSLGKNLGWNRAENLGQDPGKNIGKNLGGNRAENLGRGLGRNLSCMSDGVWERNDTPRKLPWSKDAFGSSCDKFHVHGNRGIAFTDADHAAETGNRDGWHVRLELKFEWRPQPADCRYKRFDRNNMCRLLDTMGNVLFVGDSMQGQFARTLLSHMQMNESG